MVPKKKFYRAEEFRICGAQVVPSGLMLRASHAG